MELLVVITIIGMLIALLLPAVQMAREAARQAQCRNNLKQLAMGCLLHESATGRLPTGGWGYAWTGDADLGNDWRQPGGWIYNILPYIEQQALHNMGAGLPTTEKNAAHLQRLANPLAVLHCPSRRPATTYPWTTTSAQQTGGNIYNAGKPTVAAHTDYAANGGDQYSVASDLHSLWDPQSGPANPPASVAEFGAVYSTGVVFAGSMIKMADLRDGTSRTYLLGEKYLNPDNYATGTDNGDNEDAMMGDNHDITRWTAARQITQTRSYYPPRQDTPGYTHINKFGSAHANGFYTAFCDGSVELMNFTIDVQVHCRLGDRQDGQMIDSNKL